MGNGTSLTEYDCAGCGQRVTRKPTKGQRPKWCADCRARCLRSGATCTDCGQHVTAGSVRCQACYDRARMKPVAQPVAPRDLRSDMRIGYEDKDWQRLMRAIQSGSQVNVAGCWIWQRGMRDGYPTARIAGKEIGVHRLSLMAKHQAHLGSQHAHHICAVSACVNPNHLQPVTHRDNVAEMLARHSYLARIRELESALSDLAPEHPLLDVIAVA